ncbi:hypothetical protein MTO96_018651 [Rhipicephalus appendiculatus]
MDSPVDESGMESPSDASFVDQSSLEVSTLTGTPGGDEREGVSAVTLIACVFCAVAFLVVLVLVLLFSSDLELYGGDDDSDGEGDGEKFPTRYPPGSRSGSPPPVPVTAPPPPMTPPGPVATTTAKRTTRPPRPPTPSSRPRTSRTPFVPTPRPTPAPSCDYDKENDQTTPLHHPPPATPAPVTTTTKKRTTKRPPPPPPPSTRAPVKTTTTKRTTKRPSPPPPTCYTSPGQNGNDKGNDQTTRAAAVVNKAAVASVHVRQQDKLRDEISRGWCVRLHLLRLLRAKANITKAEFGVAIYDLDYEDTDNSCADQNTKGAYSRLQTVSTVLEISGQQVHRSIQVGRVFTVVRVKQVESHHGTAAHGFLNEVQLETEAMHELICLMWPLLRILGERRWHTCRCDDGSWGPQHGRGPDADRKPAWGASSAGGGGGGVVAAADRAWPRPARLQQQQRPVFAGRVFMTAADAGGPGASGGALTFGGGFGRGGIIDPRAMDLDLSNLTLAEREAIMQVLQRDQALRKMEERRILHLKAELQRLRKRGALRPGLDPARSCARCLSALGRILNRGALCPSCRKKVCRDCRLHEVGAPENSDQWLCVVCHKQM